MTRINQRATAVAAAVLTVAMLAFSAPAFAQEVSPDQLALARKYVDLTDKVDVYGTTIATVAAQTLNQVYQKVRLSPFSFLHIFSIQRVRGISA